MKAIGRTTMKRLKKIAKSWYTYIHPWIIVTCVIALCAELVIGVLNLIEPVAWILLKYTGAYAVLATLVKGIVLYVRKSKS